MKTGVTIRERMKLGDLGEVTRLHGTVYGQERGHGIAFEAYVAQGVGEFYHQYDHSRDRIWLCEDGDRLVGMLFLMHRGEAAQLRYFLVLPEYRGTGLGKEMMARYMSALDKLEYATSFLWTTHELSAAASLYTRHGFVLTENKPSERFGKPLIEQKYEWHRGA